MDLPFRLHKNNKIKDSGNGKRQNSDQMQYASKFIKNTIITNVLSLCYSNSGIKIVCFTPLQVIISHVLKQSYYIHYTVHVMLFLQIRHDFWKGTQKRNHVVLAFKFLLYSFFTDVLWLETRTVLPGRLLKKQSNEWWQRKRNDCQEKRQWTFLLFFNFKELLQRI